MMHRLLIGFAVVAVVSSSPLVASAAEPIAASRLSTPVLISDSRAKIAQNAEMCMCRTAAGASCAVKSKCRGNGRACAGPC
jgi:hypothetical protein